MSALHIHTILFGLMVFMASGCGKPCKGKMEPATYPEALHKYFDVYRPGNWWVYENGTGQKDSVHVTGYKEEYRSAANLKPCISRPVRTMGLNTSQMTDGTPLYILYLVSTTNSSGFSISTNPNGAGRGVSYENDSYHGDNLIIHGDSVMFGNTYHNLIGVDYSGIHGVLMTGFTVARNMGIVQFTTASDTFNLIQSNLR